MRNFPGGVLHFDSETKEVAKRLIFCQRIMEESEKNGVGREYERTGGAGP
jgi:hypothetical protein